jgi:hypothetical protein
MTFLARRALYIKETNPREWDAWKLGTVIIYIQRAFWILQEMVLNRWNEGTLDEGVMISLEKSDALTELLRRILV